MKTNKIMTLSFFLLISTNIYSQAYTSMFSDNLTRWNIYESVADAGGTIAYYTDSDTIINDKTYHKIYSERLYSPDQVIGGSESELCGFVHEDTLEGKYWFRKFYDGDFVEVLFMDLSLNIGDTMCIISNFSNMWTDSVIVEDVSFENGKRIITLDFITYHLFNSEKLKFFEGIGASNGFYAAELFETPEIYQLLCKYVNEELIYSFNLEQYPDCYQDGGGGVDENNSEDVIQIYPNPAKSGIKISKLKNELNNLEFTVYNITGKEIKTGLIEESEINLELKNKGIYFINIFNSNFNITKKIIIE